MNRKFKSLAGGLAVAGLVVAGAVGAGANGAVKVEKIGYFEVQDESETAVNEAPAGWFSERDDVVSALSITEEGLKLASTSHFPSSPSSAVGVNKIIGDPFDPAAGFEIDAEGTARYSLVLKSDEVSYLRISAADNTLTEWVGTGYHDHDPDTGRIGHSRTQSLEDWAAEAFLAGKNPTLHQIGVRHHTREGAGLVRSLTYAGTKYVFTPTGFDQADVDAALAVVPAGYVKQTDLDAANTKVADLEARLAKAVTDAAKAEADAKKALAKADRATDKAADSALKAQARAPYRITGSAKVGKTLRVKGTKYKGVSVKFQWYVGGKKAGKKATLKLKKSHANKRVNVVVTKTYRNSANKKYTVKQTVHLTSKARAKR